MSLKTTTTTEIVCMCLCIAGTRQGGSEWCCVWGGESSEGGGEKQWRERTTGLAQWGRGSWWRYGWFSLLFFMLTLSSVAWFRPLQNILTTLHYIITNNAHSFNLWKASFLFVFQTWQSSTSECLLVYVYSHARELQPRIIVFNLICLKNLVYKFLTPFNIREKQDSSVNHVRKWNKCFISN